MNTQPSNSSAQASKRSRLPGVLLVILGLVAAYFSIVLPLQEAYEHAPKVSFSFKLAFLSPVLLVLGILAIIVPGVMSGQSFMMKSPNKLSVAGWVLVAALAIVGFGTYYLLDQQISSLGYK